MRKFATADCETDPFKNGRVPIPFIWGHYTLEEGFKYFFETKDFVDFIRDREEIIYFHNGGKFDVHFLFEYIDEQSDVMVVNGRIAKIKIGKAELRDSFMLLPVPLSAYKKDDFDYNKMEKENRKANMPEIHTYLSNDCIYLYEILAKNFALYGQKISLASSAFDFWHKKHSTLKYKPKSPAGFFKTYQPYYFGGRVECFKKGIVEEKFNVYDIRSAYPRAMLEEHPYGTEYKVSTKLPDTGIEICLVKFRGRSFGCLPHRDKGLKFSHDEVDRNYFATGWELKAGLEAGTIKIRTIERVTKFTQTINFKDYVGFFYEEKEKHRTVKGAEYLLAKLYLNSLYGKFGQNSEDHRNYELIEPQYIQSQLETCCENTCKNYNDYCGIIEHRNWTYENLLGKLALVSCPIREEKRHYYNVVTAASITGFVRAYLYEQLRRAENLLYCDTDSIACTGFQGKIGNEIGDWEDEGSFIRAAIGGKKLYAFEKSDEDKNKSISKREKELERKLTKQERYDAGFKISSKGVRLSAGEILDIASGEEIEYKNIAPTFSIGNEPKFVKRKVKRT